MWKRTASVSVEEIQKLFRVKPSVPKSVLSRNPFESTITTSLKPLNQASRSVPHSSLEALSNLLYYRTRNQHLRNTDFESLWQLGLSSFNVHGIKPEISLIRSREPDNLIPRGGYYLVFESIDLASAYLVDNLGTQMNGINVYFEMVDPPKHLQYIKNRHIHENITINDGVLSIDPQSKRNRTVIVNGFPTFITKDTIENMLWDYSLDYSTQPVTPVFIDNFSKIGTWLLTFSNQPQALSFVRDFHGKHFNGEERLSKVFASVLD